MFKSETVIGYSLALLDIAKEENKIETFYNQSNLIISILEDESEFEQILDSSNLDIETKNKIIEKTFDKFHWSIVNVIKMLSFKNQFKYFEKIIKNLIKYLQDILNIRQGIIYSTEKISPTKISQLEKKLEAEYKYKVKLKNLIDKELIGGFKIVIDSFIIEDSIKSELLAMKKTLKSKKEGGV